MTCKNVKDINALSSQKDTLEKVILHNGSIADCRVFKELKNLTYVDLQNNPFGDYISNAENLDNWNLKVICEAVEEGVRRANEKNGTNILGTVKVKGTKCTNWTFYTERKWSGESNYGL